MQARPGQGRPAAVCRAIRRGWRRTTRRRANGWRARPRRRGNRGGGRRTLAKRTTRRRRDGCAGRTCHIRFQCEGWRATVGRPQALLAASAKLLTSKRSCIACRQSLLHRLFELTCLAPVSLSITLTEIDLCPITSPAVIFPLCGPVAWASIDPVGVINVPWPLRFSARHAHGEPFDPATLTGQAVLFSAAMPL